MEKAKGKKRKGKDDGLTWFFQPSSKAIEKGGRKELSRHAVAPRGLNESNKFRGLLKLKFDLLPTVDYRPDCCLLACLPAWISESTNFDFALENFPPLPPADTSTLAEAIDRDAYIRKYAHVHTYINKLKHR